MVIRRLPPNEKNEIAEFGTDSKSENLEFWNFGTENGSKKLELLEQFQNSKNFEQKAHFYASDGHTLAPAQHNIHSMAGS